MQGTSIVNRCAAAIRRRAGWLVGRKPAKRQAAAGMIFPLPAPAAFPPDVPESSDERARFIVPRLRTSAGRSPATPSRIA
jgi:hypothetical protein